MQIGWNLARQRHSQVVTFCLLGMVLVVFTWGLKAAAQSGSQAPLAGAAYSLPPAKLAQAKALERVEVFLHFGAELWSLVLLVLLLTGGLAGGMAQWMEARTGRKWLQVGGYSAALVLLLFALGDLPVDAIGHAYSLRYGISIERWSPWAVDQAKMLGLALLLETPVLMLVFGLMSWEWSRRRYWLWFAVAAVPILLVGTFLLPALVEPLFYHFEPLAQSHPALVQDLERVVARTGTQIPPERMFLMRASEKSNGLNAYVTGLGASKRIVVWDTTADRMPEDEILFTFAHETGHYVLNHIMKGLALAAVGMSALFWAVAQLAGWMVVRWGQAFHLGHPQCMTVLVVLLLSLTLLQTATEPIGSTISRHFEHEADVYGQEAIHGIVPNPQKTAVAAFNELGEAYLEDPEPHPFVEFWTESHPSIQNRATFAAHYNPWASGRRPQFFTK